MPPLLIAIGFLAGVVLGALVAVGTMQRRRAALVRELHQRVLPVLERRAVTLNVATNSTPQVNVSGDGDLELDAADTVSRVLRLADAIDEHEHAQLGFVDTIRVSKDDVDQHVSGQRKKLG